jgi:hypothetical protein
MRSHAATAVIIFLMGLVGSPSPADEIPEVRWARQLGSLGPPFDGASAIARDSSGNLYVVGQVGGPLTDESESAASAGLDDGFVRKYGAAGNLIWSRQFGTSQTDIARAVAADDSGIYVAGETSGSLYASIGGVRDAFLVKYSPAGTVSWTRQFGTAGSDVARGVAVDSTGVYVVGDTGGALVAGGHKGGQDAFIRKYDPAGAILWTDQVASDQNVNDAANAVAICGEAICVVGRAGGSLPEQTSAGLNDVFVRFYTRTGTIAWTREFGTAADDQGLAVAADGEFLYVAGQTSGSLQGSNKGQADGFVRRYDFFGSPGWTSQFGTKQNDFILAAAVGDDAVYVGGTTRGTNNPASIPEDWLSDPALTGTTRGTFGDAFLRKMAKDTGAAAWTHQFGGRDGTEQVSGIATDGPFVHAVGLVGGFGLAGEPEQDGSFNAFLQKYDASGTLPVVFTRQFGAGPIPVNDAAFAVAVDAEGNTYVGGQVEGSLPGKTSAGFVDAFVTKYDRSGVEQWVTQFGGTRNEAVAVIAVSGGNVYVAGGTNSTLPGQQPAGPSGTDSYIMKLHATTGATMWTVQFGVAADDAVNAIAIEGNAIYVAGRTAGKLADEVGGGAAFGLDDAYVRRYVDSGESATLSWSRQFGTAADDRARALALGELGLLVATETRGSLNGVGSLAGQTDVFISCFDSSGTLRSEPMLQFGSAGIDLPTGIAQSGSAFYVSGQTAGALVDGFVRRYSVSGSEVWRKELATSADDLATGIALDATGVYVCGNTDGALSPAGRAGQRDGFTQKRDPPTGTLLWSLQFGTAVADEAAAMALDMSNPADVGLLVVGRSEQGIFGQSHSGRSDAYVVRIDQVTTVTIDIKPGRTSNDINLSSAGLVPVAILGSPGFDAATLDPETVELASAAVALRGNGTPMASLEDVNGDGRLDLVVHVDTEALELTDGDVEAEVRARTFSGTQLKGTDAVRIVP